MKGRNPMKRWTPYIAALVVFAALALFLQRSDSQGELSNDWWTQFAIEDSASIDRIRIADVQGRVADLTRQDGHPLGLWRINNTFDARKDASDLLLKTAMRTRVQQPVTDAAEAGVLKMIATAGKRVDFFQRGSAEPVRTWFIGTPTQNHSGTNMLLELPNEGRAPVPFVTHMEGFTGFLSTRFFTDELDWRYTGVYDQPFAKITSITAIPRSDKGRAARIVLPLDGGQPHAQALDGSGLDYAQDEIEAVVRRFEKVHVETWMSHLAPAAEDSVRQSVPAWDLIVAYRDGEMRRIQLFWKQKIQNVPDEIGNILPFDESRMYAAFNGELALVQTFVFNPILKFWRDLEAGQPVPSPANQTPK